MTRISKLLEAMNGIQSYDVLGLIKKRIENIEAYSDLRNNMSKEAQEADKNKEVTIRDKKELDVLNNFMQSYKVFTD